MPLVYMHGNMAVRIGNWPAGLAWAVCMYICGICVSVKFNGVEAYEQRARVSYLKRFGFALIRARLERNFFLL